MTIAAAAAVAVVIAAAATLTISVSAEQGVDADTCKVVLFRHVEKVGGTALRLFFSGYQNEISCGGQFCNRIGNVIPGDWDRVRADINMLIRNRKSGKKGQNDRVFFELHHHIRPANFEKILDTLDELRATGCNTLSLVLLRDPLKQAYSDYHFFHRDHLIALGNDHATFMDFIHAYPENLIRRLSCKDYFNVDISGNYTSSPWQQQQLYTEAHRFVKRFDLVATTDTLSTVWKYLCSYFELSNNINLKKIASTIRVQLDFSNIHTCEDLPKEIKMYAQGDKGGDRARSELDSDQKDIVKQYNVASYRLWKEAQVAEESFFYFFNQTLS